MDDFASILAVTRVENTPLTGPLSVSTALPTLAGFSVTNAQPKPGSVVFTVSSLTPVAEPLPLGLQCPLSLSSGSKQHATPLEVPQEASKSGIIEASQLKRRRKGRKSMSRRIGQNGNIVIQSGWYRVRWRMDVEGQEQRINMSEKVAPVMLDKEGKPKPPSQEVRRLAREMLNLDDNVPFSPR